MSRAVIVAALALLPARAEAGAWTRSLGSAYAKLGADLYVADEYVIPGGGDAATQSYVGQQYGVYAELGVLRSHPLQIAVSAPLTIGTVAFEREDSFQTASGSVVSVRPGDLRLRPQVALHPSIPVALAVEAKIPLYGVDGICADQGPFRTLCPRPGDGQVDLSGWLLAGASSSALPLWGELGLGYMHRTEWYVGWTTDIAFADSLAWSANAGATFGPLLVMLKGDGVHPVVRDDVTMAAVRAGPAVLWTVVGGLGLEARAQWDLYARAASKGLGAGVGVSWRR